MVVSSDCSATARISGDGDVLVDGKSRKQEHDLTESLAWLGDGRLQGRGSGTLKVFGMPLGLGKLGKVRDDQSAWAFSTDTLCIRQNLNIAFRTLCLGKSFKIAATYTAVRGADVSSQFPKPASVVSAPLPSH